MPQTLGREERLKSSKTIQDIFNKRCSVSKFPMRMLWTETPMAKCCTVAVSVSKKHFKHAVDRNRIKRLLREVYRTSRERYLADIQDQRYAFVIIWSDSTMPTLSSVQESMDSVFKKWNEKIKQCS